MFRGSVSKGSKVSKVFYNWSQEGLLIFFATVEERGRTLDHSNSPDDGTRDQYYKTIFAVIELL